MKAKNCNLISPLKITKGSSIIDAAKILRENKQRRIIVVDKKDFPIGIISTTDLCNKLVAEGKDPKKVMVDEIMVSPIYLVCDYEDSINEIFEKMTKHETFFVPITKGKKLYGILTYGELMHQVREAIKND